MPRRASPPDEVSEGVVSGAVIPRAPHLALETPDPGLVHPFGDTLAESAREEPDLDVPTWVCTSCGYQWDRRGEPSQCPNCAVQDSFTRAG